MKLGTYIMAPEPISTAYFINSSHQFVCLYVYTQLQLLGNGSLQNKESRLEIDLTDSECEKVNRIYLLYSLYSASCCVINLIVYYIPPTQLYEYITINCLLKLKITTCFDLLCGHHQVITGSYMCILNCKGLPNIWAHIYNWLCVAIYMQYIYAKYSNTNIQIFTCFTIYCIY
jgi:hypothetical protein